jgi:hypothetical protein
LGYFAKLYANMWRRFSNGTSLMFDDRDWASEVTGLFIQTAPPYKSASRIAGIGKKNGIGTTAPLFGRGSRDPSSFEHQSDIQTLIGVISSSYQGGELQAACIIRVLRWALASLLWSMAM